MDPDSIHGSIQSLAGIELDVNVTNVKHVHVRLMQFHIVSNVVMTELINKTCQCRIKIF